MNEEKRSHPGCECYRLRFLPASSCLADTGMACGGDCAGCLCSSTVVVLLAAAAADTEEEKRVAVCELELLLLLVEVLVEVLAAVAVAVAVAVEVGLSDMKVRGEERPGERALSGDRGLKGGVVKDTLRLGTMEPSAPTRNGC
mmetsp:Transcript_50558/g.99041  ORF Transcript_50558/g.99041 Transcript_50558/m.99041 type:complete len:143 (+) Transcript_50558:145-573(+)